jgi:hypothetical protein
MRFRRSYLASGMALGLLLASAFGRAAMAQTGTLGAPVPITLAATAADKLVVVVLSGSVQTIASLTPNAINQFPTPVQIYTEWNLPYFFGGTLSLVAYFTNPGQALTTGTANIPSSRVEGLTSGSDPSLLTTWTPFNGNAVGGVGSAGGTQALWRWPGYCGLLIFCRQGDRTDQLDLRLNLVGYPTAAGTYAGVLNIRAVIY